MSSNKAHTETKMESLILQSSILLNVNWVSHIVYMIELKLWVVIHVLYFTSDCSNILECGTETAVP